MDGAVIVTTPQEVAHHRRAQGGQLLQKGAAQAMFKRVRICIHAALIDVRMDVNFCKWARPCLSSRGLSLLYSCYAISRIKHKEFSASSQFCRREGHVIASAHTALCHLPYVVTCTIVCALTALETHSLNPMKNLQVGLRVLGVVENMSGLRMPAAALRFSAPDGRGGERDVSDAVRAALAGFPGPDSRGGRVCAHPRRRRAGARLGYSVVDK